MKTFPIGGVHPSENKLSGAKPIEVLPLPDAVAIPLAQHIGAPAAAKVAKGDKVLTGQLIAEASSFMSANIHSPISGTVTAVDAVPNGQGLRQVMITIKREGDEWAEGIDRSETLVRECALSSAEIIARIKDAGIVGMGGAGFPTFIKLSPKEPEKIDIVIANCAECEPYLTSDYRRMLEEPEKLVGGLKVSLKLFENARGILAVEDNKPDCIELLKNLTKDEPRISVKALKTKYPQGAERQIIYAATGRAINSSMLPADAGCVVNNVDTVVAIYHAVIEGKPLMNRIVTVTGDAIADPRNFIVRIGTNYHELVEEAGGFKQEPVKIVSGGPMMGFALFGLDVPTTKTASALLCLTEDEVSRMEPSACINCGRCVEVCPGRVVPRLLADYAEHYDEEAFLSHEGMECCECGCCSFVCPAKRPLTQTIKSMRKMQLAKKKK